MKSGYLDFGSKAAAGIVAAGLAFNAASAEEPHNIVVAKQTQAGLDMQILDSHVVIPGATPQGY